MKEAKGAILLPVAQVLALGGAAVPPLALAAVGAPLAAAAVVLQWRRSNRSLRTCFSDAKTTLARLEAERDSALAERDAALEERDAVYEHYKVLRDSEEERHEEFQSMAADAKGLAGRYEALLLDSDELQARLTRSEGFNQELQQTIRRERTERAAREKRIAELERRIREQKVLLDAMRKDGAQPARVEEAKAVLGESNAWPALVTPPLAEAERRQSSGWPARLARPPVPFRDISLPQAQ